MRYEEAAAALEARGEGRMVPSLDRIRAVAELLGDPQLAYPTVHVAGTNGKTTTARLVARILCAHGLATGLTTSPHLLTVTERLAICDERISPPEFAETYTHLEPYLREVDARGEPVTYFETLAAMAYLWFADKPVDVGVFEVGMGGSWDATNLIRSDVAIVCPIGLDHRELGDSVEKVAGEKAGIVKEGTRAVLREQRPEARKVLEARASEVGAELHVEGEAFELTGRELAVGGQQISVRGTRGEYRDLALRLHGEHQARNAAAAIAGAELFLGRALAADPLREALSGVSSPGRLEVVSRHPLIVLDGAHNPDGTEALASAIGEAFLWKRLFLIVSILDTKDAAGILEALATRATTAYACASSHPRALPAERMAELCDAAGIPATPHATVAEALDAAEAAAADDDLILVTGSLYTVADARPRYLKEL